MMIAVQVGRCHSKGGLLWEREKLEISLPNKKFSEMKSFKFCGLKFR